MIIHGTKLDGVHIIQLERREDERGFFSRIWCRTEFEAAGLDPEVAQASLSFKPGATATGTDPGAGGAR
jgi:dTDP-4-dehydrorhamnose 3,5-epimerase